MDKNNLEYSDDLLFTVKYEKNIWANILLYIIGFGIIMFFIFIYYAQIDERVKGLGKVIPKTRVVNIQSLYSGVIDKVYKFEGDEVKKGDKLIKLNPVDNLSKHSKSIIKLNINKSQKVRLIEEKNYLLESNVTLVFDNNLTKYKEIERDIFNKRVVSLGEKIEGLQYKKAQKVSKIKNFNIKITELEKSEKLLKKEIKINEELYQAKAISLATIYRLQRELNTMTLSIKSYKEEIIEFSNAMNEIELKIKESLSLFRLRATQELSTVNGEIESLQATLMGQEDRLQRRTLISPVNGIVKNLYFSHKDEVVRSAEVIEDILPTDDELLIEVKITPKDIAFMAIDQHAMVNITAYDFSIYGGLEGKIIEIGVDSVFDKMRGKYDYVIKVLTKQNYLLSPQGKKLKIIPGMVAEVNILTGKKTIFDFIFKPILKTIKNSFHER